MGFGDGKSITGKVVSRDDFHRPTKLRFTSEIFPIWTYIVVGYEYRPGSGASDLPELVRTSIRTAGFKRMDDSWTEIIAYDEGKRDLFESGYVPSMFITKAISSNLGFIVSSNGLMYQTSGTKRTRLYRTADPDLPPPFDPSSLSNCVAPPKPGETNDLHYEVGNGKKGRTP
jgi:hypothetical protein